MITFEADLYVDKVGIRGEYDQKIDCRVDKDESKAKYPQKMTVIIGKKGFEKFDSDFCKDDKIHVKVYPTTRSGVSKSSGKAYSITELKVVDLKIVERAALPKDVEVPAEDESLPF